MRLATGFCVALASAAVSSAGAGVFCAVAESVAIAMVNETASRNTTRAIRGPFCAFVVKGPSEGRYSTISLTELRRSIDCGEYRGRKTLWQLSALTGPCADGGIWGRWIRLGGAEFVLAGVKVFRNARRVDAVYCRGWFSAARVVMRDVSVSEGDQSLARPPTSTPSTRIWP